ncbi:hypothetical protein [Dyadobacter chenhuakuii]|uniref:hypothetical protein n=1 Tax=Dyadobacter chenhuakuii TaxID=2909339 RepID=UPI00286E5F61|nr:hypothetical protein [Dyadobacter chenhuakuii]
MAVFRLPPEMQVFYKKNIDFITENAVNPDRRRYAVVGEAERHYIDLDVYGDSAVLVLTPQQIRFFCLKSSLVLHFRLKKSSATNFVTMYLSGLIRWNFQPAITKCSTGRLSGA